MMKIRNESGDPAADTTEIHTIIRDCYEKLYAKTSDNLEKMSKFLDRHKLPILNQEEIWTGQQGVKRLSQ